MEGFNYEECIYQGMDLGATYNIDYTLFKVWAPGQQEVKVIVYDNYFENDGKVYPLSKGENGVWELRLEGDHKNKYYNYVVKSCNLELETPDPYTKGASANGKKGMIVDFQSINPEGWENHKIPEAVRPTESVIYEMHVRDFSTNKTSGILNKGKYLAFTELETENQEGLATGIEYLKELGVTHLHLMPVFDFKSVDETIKHNYNWGYDPHLYNVPEGSYATNPYDGKVRIQEFKKMIMTLHENGIRVVMDVVYNHTFEVGDSPFDILVPNYYYRTYHDGSYSNGSGCGNEIASERPMVRRFIIDSLKFWAKEYKIDGFRFDLMALHDIDTMKEIEKELVKINPDILIYGEPWTGGDSLLPYEKRFHKGVQKGSKVAVFNDDFRNDIKGDNDGTSSGFVNGGLHFEHGIKKGIVGSIDYDQWIKGFTLEPIETINYVSSHDNLSLFDKIEKSRPDITFEERVKMNRLALSIILTSQGIPFIQGGTEILRTKNGDHNSYKAGDEINGIDWSRKNKFIDIFVYIKELISLRKSQRVMCLEKAQDVRKHLKFIDSPERSVAYLLESPYKEDYKYIFIIHNAGIKEISLKLPFKGQWKVIANEHEVKSTGVSIGIRSFEGEVNIKAISTYILCKE